MNDSSASSQHWEHDLSPFLIQFTENFGIRYYGLAYIMGFLIGLWLLARYYKAGHSSFDKNQQTDIFLILIAGVLVGGRLGYVLFYQPFSLLHDPLSVIRVWDGGMSSHGGFLGVAAACWYISRRYKQPFWHVADIIGSLAPAGLFLGRIANFINGELWGKASTVSWAVIFPKSFDNAPRHPSQLYEASLEGMLMLIYTQWRIWKTPVLKNAPGLLIGEFIFGYAIVRILGEQFREPDHFATIIMGLSRGSFLSVFMAIAGIAMIWYARRRASKAPN